MKKDTTKRITGPLLYVVGLVILFIIAYSYIFDSKLDTNGDNCVYYMLASSLSSGHGYSDVLSGTYRASNSFPPGYPILMSIIRVFTDSLFLQKVLNGIFLLASVLLLFFFVRKNQLPTSLAFVASAVALLNYQTLRFSTMMMSEMSFLFFSVLTLWFLYKMNKEKPFWKDGYFYLSILSTSYCFHIRTQGITLVVAAIGYFLFARRWKESIAFTGGFAVTLLPWMLRNKLLNMGGSRYFDLIFEANHWSPDEGLLGLEGIISRFFDTLGMLASKALPNSIIPYLSADYITPNSTFGQWVTGIILLALIVYGMCQFGKYKYFLILYAAATFGIISLLSTPSGNRYLTSILPILEVCLVVGIYAVMLLVVRKLSLAKGFSPWILSVLLFFSFPKLQELHAINKAPFSIPYQSFFKLAGEVHKNLPPNTVVCSRKPELFYMFSHTPVTGYAWTEDDKALIRGLIESKTDYVVLEDNLGFSQTPRFLFPAIQKNPDFFEMVMNIPNTNTYLLKFNREKAQAEIN
ncbi:hypothetical protein AGMMS49574_27880 [Bacteroidia bacterium]|nr:hypothetical protein AGMMS49574_27880 [Bacteroidia bacterium]